MDTHTSPQNDMAAAMAIAGDARSQARFAGPATPQSRSVWGRMNAKVKILVLALPVGLFIAFNPLSEPSAPSPAAKAPSEAPAPAHAAQAPEAAPLAAKPAAAAPKFDGAVGPLSPSARSAPPVAKAAPAPAAHPLAAPASPKPRETNPLAIDPIAKALPDGGRGMSSFQIANALAEIDGFASMATAIEEYKEKPYYDPGGLNVGMGYCITKRLAEYGKERVRADLSSAGFTPTEVDTLLRNKDRKAIAKINVNAVNAVRLIDATRDDYRGLARNAIGASVFDKMPEHRQTAMSYLAYNTGDVGQFKQLVSALRGGNDSKAMLNMTVKWRDNGGEIHANHRLRSYIQAMFLGPEHFKRAISDPHSFEGHMANANAESALAEIAGAAQKPDGLSSKLLARRMQANPWAFKAYSAEKQKLPVAKGL